VLRRGGASKDFDVQRGQMGLSGGLAEGSGER
jgi:hypothetical protein